MTARQSFKIRDMNKAQHKGRRAFAFLNHDEKKLCTHDL